MRYLRTQLHAQRRLELRVAARRHNYWVSPVRTQAKLAASPLPDVLSRAISRRRRPRRPLSGAPLTPALAIRELDVSIVPDATRSCAPGRPARRSPKMGCAEGTVPLLSPFLPTRRGAVTTSRAFR